MKTISIPASTANLGPGFDILGAGLSLYLTLSFKLAPRTVLKYSGSNPDSVPLDPSLNFITKVASFVANAFDAILPTFELEICNPIPLGRGLGSSGSAVVGGVMLANELLDLKLSTQQIFDFSVLIEGHPDNVAGSVFGGWVCSMVRCPLPAFEDHWFIPGRKVPTPTSILQQNNLTGNGF